MSLDPLASRFAFCKERVAGDHVHMNDEVLTMADKGGTSEVVLNLPREVRHTDYPDGDFSESIAVACPLRGASVSLETCASCPHYLGLRVGEDGYQQVQCRVPTDRLPRRAKDMQDLLTTAKVLDVMTARVTCLDTELSLAEAARVLHRDRLPAAPVVEDEGVLLGMLSATDVLPPEEELVDGRHCALVEDVMVSEPEALLETTSMDEAICVLAQKGRDRLPVVTDKGRVVGMLSSSDVIRWLARNLPGA